jgi:signal transduction histidine kinase
MALNLIAGLSVLGIAFVVNSLLVIFVYLNNPRSATNRIYALLGIFISIWIITTYSAQAPIFEPVFLMLTRLTFFFATPMNIAFLLLAHTLPSNTLQLRKRWLILLLGSGLLVMIVVLTPLAVRDIEIVDGAPRPIPGPGLALFGPYSVLINLTAVFILLRRYRRAAGRQRAQFRVVAWGIMLMFGLIIISVFLPVALWGNASLVPLIPLYTLIFLGMTAYAIMRHGFLDIRVLVARAVSYLMLVVVLAAVYTIVLSVGAAQVFNIIIDARLFVAGLILTTVAVVLFQPVLAVVQRLTNKIFFKGRYDATQLLANLTRIMAETIDLDQMTHRILSLLTKEMKMSKAAFLLIEKHRITDVKGIGYQTSTMTAAQLETLFHRQFEEQSNFVLEDLQDTSLKPLFQELDIAIAIPVKVEETEVAVLALGPKLSGEIYQPHDIATLTTFAAEAGIAIQNAKAYTAIKKFSEELEEMVEERTKQLKETQERELEKARQVNKLKDEFVFIAAHELRTPVTAIRGFLELVAEAQRNFPKDVQEHLNTIGVASDHLNQLVNDLLEVARSDAGTMKVKVEPIDIVPIAEGIVNEFGSLAQEKELTVTVEAKGKVAKALADSNKVKEVMSNLVSNAIKYNRPKGQVQVIITSPSNTVTVEVHDTGYGIPKDQQEKIFQKFFRAESNETHNVLGPGLGLFVTRMLVEKMGGKITFTSVEGEGTVFTVGLPRA